MSDDPAEALIQGYLDGSLGPSEEAELLGAIQSDPALLLRLERSAWIDGQLRETFSKAAPRTAPLKDRVLEEIHRRQAARLRERVGSKIARGTRRRWGWIASAAGVAAVAGMVLYYFYPEVIRPIARLERVDGTVLVLPGRERTTSARDLFPGQGVETLGAAAGGVLVYPDGSRVTLGRESALEGLQDREAGKRLTLRRGSLAAAITPQRSGKPMVFATPQGEATVLGTALRLAVDLDTKKGTTLSVDQGRVRLKNLAGKSVEVASGHFAVAAEGVELVSKPSRSEAPSLVARWAFEEEGGLFIEDASGRGHQGTLTGELRRVPGRFGRALELDGANHVLVPHSEALDPGASPWTVSAWIRKGQGGRQTVVFKDNGSFSQYYYLAVDERARFAISPGDQQIMVDGTSSLIDGAWHHVVGVRSAPRTVEIYVDGLREGTRTLEGPGLLVETSAPLKIGAGTVIPGLGPFKGSISDVRLYNRALNPEEIKALYLGR